MIRILLVISFNNVVFETLVLNMVKLPFNLPFKLPFNFVTNQAENVKINMTL